jgi:NAD(P)-dependent dehydrogenase (short-subunit alcohol dehydrogenase family)
MGRREGFSEVLSREVAPLGIKVTIIEPGGFRTGVATEYRSKTVVVLWSKRRRLDDNGPRGELVCC